MPREFLPPLPHEINATHGKVYYRCRPCGAETNLHWFRGTSCPVCNKPECTAQLEIEWEAAYAADIAD
jgi:hypothetical protein